MNFIVLLIFILVGVGITNIIVNGAIFDRPRDWVSGKSTFLGSLFSCMLCSGFWVGALLGVFNPQIGILISAALVSLFGGSYGAVSYYLSVLTDVKLLEIESWERDLLRDDTSNENDVTDEDEEYEN